jgi:hypothetical protein
MKHKVILILGVLAALTFWGCDWNSHTEPELTVNNAEILGGAIFVNSNPMNPGGNNELFVNEGDTVRFELSTMLLRQPNYKFEAEDDNVVKIQKDPDDNMVAYAIALADSGATTTLKITDQGNSNATRTITVNIVAHWADPFYFDFIGSFQGHYYYISRNLRGWIEAERICREAGGYMVAINTVEENSFLDEARGNVENVWIGIRLNNVNGSFKLTTWANGEEIEYRSFNSTDYGIFAEAFYYMDANGKWENWHEISYNYFLEME